MSYFCYESGIYDGVSVLFTKLYYRQISIVIIKISNTVVHVMENQWNDITNQYILFLFTYRIYIFFFNVKKNSLPKITTRKKAIVFIVQYVYRKKLADWKEEHRVHTVHTWANFYTRIEIKRAFESGNSSQLLLSFYINGIVTKSMKLIYFRISGLSSEHKRVNFYILVDRN